MKATKIFFIVTLSTSLLIIVYLLNNHNKEIAWVDINQIYSEFEYKKELQIKLEQTQNARKYILDSLELELKLLQNNLSRNSDKSILIEQFNQKRQNYLSQKEIFEEDNRMMIKNYDNQIINQLNQYIKDYGEENGYDFIFGADGTGSLMYANNESNITKELKEYINQRYKGQSK